MASEQVGSLIHLRNSLSVIPSASINLGSVHNSRHAC